MVSLGFLSVSFRFWTWRNTNLCLLQGPFILTGAGGPDYSASPVKATELLNRIPASEVGPECVWKHKVEGLNWRSFILPERMNCLRMFVNQVQAMKSRTVDRNTVSSLLLKVYIQDRKILQGPVVVLFVLQYRPSPWLRNLFFIWNPSHFSLTIIKITEEKDAIWIQTGSSWTSVCQFVLEANVIFNFLMSRTFELATPEFKWPAVTAVRNKNRTGRDQLSIKN